jgi:hypothetical protein
MDWDAGAVWTLSEPKGSGGLQICNEDDESPIRGMGDSRDFRT